jgi:hypothetical protein
MTTPSTSLQYIIHFLVLVQTQGAYILKAFGMNTHASNISEFPGFEGFEVETKFPIF